ncbi:hypothetical protein KAFR_0G01520 [Kazachstania africana CBS 2517]|uniref:Large ribosomal subunit protein mL59 domain-containing protein n=1 Tax=Kazachstania africana (strain ATCC 22294 / BCRC 22015 / CBS 2517 / CECT 1963 / NBRC 1671 / NRRL Y-8276) TaxID=1071382 RepID=H2AXT6_KAZAF|nr:hypothetical protein KAFR_0G01520 [Kazachstania africana CBS 2517]CCF59186.1 hypothetical protein KAFR_0G01520 [Kazachstania africana CBS 2517]
MSQANLKYFEMLPRKLKNFFAKYPPHIKYANEAVSTHAVNANPFIANKHPVTNTYHNPLYSRRRMSDIYKLAYRYGIQDLLPPIQNKAFFEEKYNSKKFMKGVLQPKGHKHELNQADRAKKMAKAITEADNTIINVKGQKTVRRLAKKKIENIRNWF